MNEKYKIKRLLFNKPDYVPIYVYKDNAPGIPDIKDNKYLVPRLLTFGQFINVVRNRVNLLPTQSVFLHIGSTIPMSSDIIHDLYEEYKDDIGVLRLTYSLENTFG